MPLLLPDGLMVSVSGFRGRVGDPLTPELVAALAARYGAFLAGGRPGARVVVGRDSRTSGPMFARAVVAGLQSVGCSVTDLGVVPTPTVMLEVERSDAVGGLCVTASHNPAEWNALKFADGPGTFLDAPRMAAFLDALAGDDPPRAEWSSVGRVRADDGAIERHLEAVLALDVLDVEAIRARRLRVALDCVHGAGGPIMTALLARLGCEVAAIGVEPDGLFPRDPEPTAANLADLAALVREHGADVGLAVDPDADRLSLVDDRGDPVGEDLTLALAAAVVLSRTPGPVVTNLSTSRVVEDVAAAYGAPLLRAPVGEINVATRMRAEGAVVGGEGNGGVILPALHLTRDAPVAAALVLQHLVDHGGALSGAVARWPSYAIVKEKVAFPREALAAAYEALAEDLAAPERDDSDGVRLAWPGERRWLHVRPSGTEPIVRLIAEAPDEAAARGLVARARALLEGVG
ncbi:MAG: phosphoglucosamine mutase [Gemmatimonadetes bacterium]|nr:MAG: phosphoglucosamine mutase [Gemmatimonadota bacterium]